MPYTDEEIKMLTAWRDRAMGYRWLHHQSMQLYKIINMRFVHASILLSALASASGFSFTGSDKFGQGIGYAVGAVNVVIGLLNSYQRFGKAAEKAELHGNVAMQYGMLYRLLDTELHLSLEHQRTDLIPFSRQEMDRLFGHSAGIPQRIIDKYCAEFPNALHKPELCDDMNVTDSPTTSESLANLLRTSFAFRTPKKPLAQVQSEFLPPVRISRPSTTPQSASVLTPIPPTTLSDDSSNATVVVECGLKDITQEDLLVDHADSERVSIDESIVHSPSPSETGEQ
jgi:hypothetical protein